MTENTNTPIEAVAVEVEEIAKIDAIVKVNGIEPSESEAIKQKYLPYFVEIAEIKQQASKINFDNPTELDEKIARELRLRTVKVRTGSEKVKDDDKKIDMLKGNIKQATWNLIKTSCQLEEEIFLKVEKRREIMEKERKELLRQERILILAPLVEDAAMYPLGEMSDQAFNELVESRKYAIEQKRIQEEKENAAKLEAELLDKLEQSRLIEISQYAQFCTVKFDLRNSDEPTYQNYLESLKQAKIDYDLKQEEIKAENERLKKEAEEKEAALKAEREAAAKVLAEQEAKAAAERKAIEAKAAKEKAEAEKAAAIEREKQAKIIAEQQAKAKAEREAQQKIIDEQQAKIKADEDAKKAQAQAELLARQKAEKSSDKVKLLAVIDKLKAVEFPELKSEVGLKVTKIYNEQIEKFCAWITAQAEVLK